MTKKERAEKVNKLIHFIGDRGRGFFYRNNTQCYATVEVDSRGRVWWKDDYTGKRIYTHSNHRWPGFSHGGTLRDLVGHFRDFIMSAKKVPSYCFGPWPETYCNGDLWGYGKENMEQIRMEALRLEVLEP